VVAEGVIGCAAPGFFMDELVLNYQVDGNGPPLLLVHGFGISFNIWQNLLPLLRQHLTLVVVELPGIGKSPMPSLEQTYLCACVEAIERVRLTLGFESWSVLGYSTGSRIAEAYVQTYAQHVSRAIFLCPLAMDAFKVLGLRIGFWIDGFVPAIGSWILRGWRLKFFISLLGFNLRSNPYADEWQNEIGALPVQVLKETLKMVIPFGANRFSVPVPVSLIWGDEDIVPLTPRKHAQCDYFVHANHAAPVIAAEEVAQAILSILK